MGWRARFDLNTAKDKRLAPHSSSITNCRDALWLSEAISNERKGFMPSALEFYPSVPWQIARERIGMNEEHASLFDMQFRQASFQVIFPQAY
eukprot:5898788-Amphidinium_carterae.1